MGAAGPVGDLGERRLDSGKLRENGGIIETMQKEATG